MILHYLHFDHLQVHYGATLGAMSAHSDPTATAAGRGASISAGEQLGKGHGFFHSSDYWCENNCKTPLLARLLNSSETPPAAR